MNSDTLPSKIFAALHAGNHVPYSSVTSATAAIGRVIEEHHAPIPFDAAMRDFCKLLEEGTAEYAKSAPAVSDYLDDLYIRINHSVEKVLLVEMIIVSALKVDGKWEMPAFASNRCYKLMNRLGMDTTGLAGF